MKAGALKAHVVIHLERGLEDTFRFIQLDDETPRVSLLHAVVLQCVQGQLAGGGVRLHVEQWRITRLHVGVTKPSFSLSRKLAETDLDIDKIQRYGGVRAKRSLPFGLNMPRAKRSARPDMIQ